MELKTIINDYTFLKQKSELVTEIDNNVLKILDKMLNTMYDNNGIGLAAVQVGHLLKLVVIDLQENNEKKPIYLINPEIIYKSETLIDSEEGCLSVPYEKASIKRNKEIKVQFLNKEGEKELLSADGLLSICLQHEIDHLNGILYINYLSKTKKNFLIKKIIKKSKVK